MIEAAAQLSNFHASPILNGLIQSEPIQQGPIQPAVSGWAWAALNALTAVMVGVGAIGRVLSQHLFWLGIRNFVLVDYKKYRDVSVSTQCHAAEIGRYKAAVVAQQLRRQGARVAGLPIPAEELDPGWLRPPCIVVASADRHSADLAAHKLALAQNVRFYKVNLEPALILSSFRFYDYTMDPLDRCLECGWDDSTYLRQRSIHSCEDVSERSTGSPRPLSELTAGWAALSIVSSLVDAAAAERLRGREFLLSPLGPVLSESILPEKTDCLGCHRRSGSLVYLVQSPGEIRFHDLALQAGFQPGEELWVGSSGLFARRCRCSKCCKEVAGLWWVKFVHQAAGWCSCGGRLLPVPFHASSGLSRQELHGVWSSPLSSLRVGRRAAVSLKGSGREVTFILR